MQHRSIYVQIGEWVNDSIKVFPPFFSLWNHFISLNRQLIPLTGQKSFWNVDEKSLLSERENKKEWTIANESGLESQAEGDALATPDEFQMLKRRKRDEAQSNICSLALEFEWNYLRVYFEEAKSLHIWIFFFFFTFETSREMIHKRVYSYSF